MNRAKCLSFIIGMVTLALLLLDVPVSAEAALDKKVLGLINQAVFEIVVLKPTRDSLTYERPLPLDLLPYTERTDKYISLGTAFTIGPGEFVSASHVLDLDHESQFKDYFIRDVNGAVYAIDKILKYSDRRDFVVFSVKDRPSGAFLPTNTAPELNDKVYAVGNALGEGIVIRDGLYTSNTPEDVNGEWKWLRFSAAASPGNSGGPLLDEAGRVIGIVLQKSPNENLNIALPIVEVLQAKAGVAQLHRKMVYFLDNMTFTKIDTLQKEFSLPKPYRQLNEELTASVEQFSATLLKLLLIENQAQIFPNGKESQALLHKFYDAVFPHLIVRGSDGSWDAQTSRETKDIELENNGLVTVGMAGHSLLLYVQKPDDIPLTAFYADSKIFMDTLLKALGITRQVGVDKVRITSFGKGRDESVFTDGYRRKWLVTTWTREYSDEKVVTFSLPVPGGCVTMMRADQTGRINGHIMDLKALTDFIYVSYYGSLKQWREFLAMKQLLPEVFSTIDIAFDYGKELSYCSRRVAFSVGQQNMAITENSDLKLNFGFFPEGGRTVWDVQEITAGEDKNGTTSFSLSRNARPPADLGDRYKSEWEKMVSRKMPYNRTSFLKDKTSIIATVYTGAMPEEKLDAATVLYHVDYMKEGTVGQKEMETALDGFLKNVTVFEDGQTNVPVTPRRGKFNRP
jgi:hypothetical protein